MQKIKIYIHKLRIVRNFSEEEKLRFRFSLRNSDKENFIIPENFPIQTDQIWEELRKSCSDEFMSLFKSQSFPKTEQFTLEYGDKYITETVYYDRYDILHFIPLEPNEIYFIQKSFELAIQRINGA